MMNTQRRAAGFTLIELVIAIAIIGILFAFVAPNFGRNVDKAKDSARQLAVKSLYGIVETHHIFEGSYPETLRTVMEENGFSLPEENETCYWYGYDNNNDQFFVAALGSEGQWIFNASTGVELNSGDCDTGPRVLENEFSLE